MVDLRKRISDLTVVLAALEGLKSSFVTREADTSDFGDKLKRLTQAAPQFGRNISQMILNNAEQSDIIEVVDLEITRLSTIKSALERNLLSQEVNSRATAVDAAELRRLQQKLAIEKATYEVFVEQFKGQSLLGGYQAALSEIYKTAMPPARPVSPIKELVMALAVVLGLFFSSALVLLLSMRRGLVWSENNLRQILSGFEITLVPSRWLRAAPKLIIGEQMRISQAVRRSIADLQASFLVAIANVKSGLILVTPIGNGHVDAMTGFVLGQAFIANGKKVAYLNLASGPAKVFDAIKTDAAIDADLTEGFRGWRIAKGGDFIFPVGLDRKNPRFDASQMLIDGSAAQAIKLLLKQYEFLIVLTPGFDAHPSVIRLFGLTDKIVLSAQFGRFTQDSCLKLARHLDDKAGDKVHIVGVSA